MNNYFHNAQKDKNLQMKDSITSTVQRISQSQLEKLFNMKFPN